MTEKPTAYSMSRSEFLQRLTHRYRSKEMSGPLHPLIIDAAKPFVLFPDSYSQSDVDELGLALSRARPAPPGAAPPTPEPFEIMLHCPMCRGKHVDVEEFATKPHHTHSCQNLVNGRPCGHTWRPAKEPTVGIEYIEGFLNAPPDPLEACRAGELERVKLERDAHRKAAEALWSMLDEISTMGDALKPPRTHYFHVVESIARRRYEVLHTDGYDLELPPKP